MATMSERGFFWYSGTGADSNGGWRFDPRLRDPAVRAAQLDRWGHERWLRCHELMRRVNCSPARRAKLQRRLRGVPQQRPDIQELDGRRIVMNRAARRGQAAGGAPSWRWSKRATRKL